MQLDKTRIGIRERGFGEILDLALKVIRVHAPAIAVTMVIGVAPFALFHAWLFAGEYDSLVEGDWPSNWHFATLVSLVVLEIPLATSLTTLYLGRVLFAERPGVKGLAGELARSLPQLLLFQGALRLLFIGPAIATLVLLDGPARTLIVIPVFLWLLPYARWPYLSEVILLERNPLRKRPAARSDRPSELSTWRRSSSLHAPAVGELMFRWMISIIIAGILVLGMWVSINYLRFYLLAESLFDRAMFSFYLPVVIWIGAGYFTVVRFLSYLDLRIRNEGWEIELKMRAEAARLARQLT